MDIRPPAFAQDLLEIEVLHQKTLILYQNGLISLIISAVNALLLAYVGGTLDAPLPGTIAWAILMVCISFGRAVLVKRYFAAHPGASSAELWRDRYLRGVVISAAGWCSGALWFLWPHTSSLYLFTGFVVGGTVAGAIAVLSADLRAYRIYATLILAPMILILVVHANQPVDWVYAALTLLFLVMVLQGAKSVHATLDSSIRLQLIQQSLLAEVGEAHRKTQTAYNELAVSKAELARNEEQFRLILEHSPTGIAQFDKDKVLTYCNDRFAEIMRTERNQCIGLRLDNLTDRRVMPVLDEALRGSIGHYEGEYRTTLSNNMLDISVVTAPVKDILGNIEGGVGIVEDVTERAEMIRQLNDHRNHLAELVEERTRELNFAKRAAEDASKAKSLFISNMSHELRTPLHQISGVARLLRRDSLSDKQIQRMDLLDGAVKRMDGLIGNILTLVDAESGSTSLAEQAVDFNPILDDVLGRVMQKAEEKGLTFRREITGLPAHLRGDASKIATVISSFVSNAVVFSEQGCIDIRISCPGIQGDTVDVLIEVEDKGIGIASEHQERLFEQFEQVDSSHTRKHGGAGIGLAVARLLAIRMGGNVSCRSTLGEGSTFWATLRLSAAPAARPLT